MYEPIDPVVTPTPNAHDDYHVDHPAFGMIGASRYQAGGGGVTLSGSDFRHHSAIRISIHTATLSRGLSSDHHYARDRIIEVDVSEAQWAAFISSMNIGMGVPCTLVSRNGERVPGIKSPPDRAAQFHGEIIETLREAEDTARLLDDAVKRGAGKRELSALVTRLRNNLTPNVSFVAERFGEHIETLKEHAKVEVSAYVTNAVTRAGLDALGVAPIAIEDKRGEDGTS